MMLTTSGPRQMQAQSEFDAMYASRTVPLLLPDAAVVVDVAGRRIGDGQMRPAQHLVLVAVAHGS